MEEPMIVFKQGFQIIKNKKYLQNPQKSVATFVKVFQQKQSWIINSDKWERLKVSQLFKRTHKVNCTNLFLKNIKQIGLIKLIQNTYMSKLKLIDLRNNRLISLEGLQRSGFQSLKLLLLGDNLFHTCKSLRRIRAPQLQSMSLYACNLITCQQIAQMQIQNIEVLTLGLNKLNQNSFMHKLNLKKLCKIFIQQNRLLTVKHSNHYLFCIQ